MADIFISYKREDRDWAETLAEALEEQGWTTWWDTSLSAGDIFDDVIEAELDKAHCVIVLWSAASIKSHWVRTEAGEGLERGILVPVFIEKVRPPLAFRRIHTADLAGWSGVSNETSFKRLVYDVKRVIGPASRPEELEEQASTQPAVVPAPKSSVHKGWEKENTRDGIEFVLIPAGSFEMGSNDISNREKPVHTVTISKPFYLGKTAVTQQQWKAVMGTTPSHFKGDDLPVEQVSWHEVQDFMKKLNATASCNGCYRLPTEAEWEYAAKAGTSTAYSFGDDAGQLGRYAWFSDNAKSQTHSVGQKLPNRWGLYDIHGNVWEWVEDWYGSYPSGLTTDPKGPETGSIRVVRGGGWGSGPANLRSANRDWNGPGDRGGSIGFRLVRTVP